MEIDREEQDVTFGLDEVTEGLLDDVIDGKLCIGFKNGRVAFKK